MSKGARYDRQLRIWGAHGQQRLEEAHVCVLHGGPCGSEALKNLVLGGIGSFTLVDDSAVSDEEFGRNYMVDVEEHGNPLAPEICRLLKELNEGVRGTPIQEAPGEVISTRPQFFKDFSLIIATQLRKGRLKQLVEICRSYEIPLITLQSYGLLGSMAVYVKEACVIESKPDDEVPDLRLGDPWPALKQFVESFDLDQMEDVEHSHVPYVVVLLKAAEKWRAASTEEIPTTGGEKREFRSFIQQLRRSEKKTSTEEENFHEATRAAYQFWTPYSIASSVKEILEDASTNTTRDSSAFWIMAAALKRFVEEHGVLPLKGSIPDMTATTEYLILSASSTRMSVSRYYLKLQGIYAKKSQEDIAQVTEFVQEILEKMELPADSIQQEKVTLMCKNARNLRLVRSWPSFLSEDPNLLAHLRNQTTFRNAGFALLMEAVDAFYQTHARLPGRRSGEEWTEDVHLLVKACLGIADLAQLEQELQSEIQSMALEVGTRLSCSSSYLECTGVQVWRRRVAQCLCSDGWHRSTRSY